MDDQLSAANVVEKIVHHIAENRFIQQKLVGDAVNHKGFRVHQPVGLEVDVKVIAGQATVNDFNRTDLNNAVPFIMGAYLVHTGGFGIQNDLSCNSCAHSARLCQTWLFTHRKSTRDA
ncbi:ribonuclease H [Cronobacter muytjensii 530]